MRRSIHHMISYITSQQHEHRMAMLMYRTNVQALMDLLWDNAPSLQWLLLSLPYPYLQVSILLHEQNMIDQNNFSIVTCTLVLQTTWPILCLWHHCGSSPLPINPPVVIHHFLISNYHQMRQVLGSYHNNHHGYNHHDKSHTITIMMMIRLYHNNHQWVIPFDQ